MTTVKIFFLTLLFSLVAQAVNSQGAQNVVFLGASITKGAGLKASETFPNIFKEILNEHEKKIYIINNAINGAASKDGINQFIKSINTFQKIDHLFIVLGISDAVYGVAPAAIKDNLKKLINKAKSHNQNMKIYLFQGKIFQRHKTSKIAKAGSNYEQAYESLFKEIQKEQNIILLPFVLEPIEGDWVYFQQDQLHPNKKGMVEIAQNIYKNIQAYFDL